MGLFGTKDWNVVAVMFEKPDLYRVNGNRGKGGDAPRVRDAAKSHARTIYWAVFDQKGAFLEGAPGPGANSIPSAVLGRLMKELAANATVREILAVLEKGTTDKAAKALVWQGYPPARNTPE